MDVKERIKEKLQNKILAWEEKSERRVYFTVRREDIVEVARFLFRDLGLRFAITTGIDTLQGIELLYHFSLDKTGEFFSARVIIEDKKNPEISSIAPLFPAAEWIEREIWELLGVNFKGHPNLRHLLLIDDWPEGKYPLRHEKT